MAKRAVFCVFCSSVRFSLALEPMRQCKCLFCSWSSSSYPEVSARFFLVNLCVGSAISAHGEETIDVAFPVLCVVRLHISPLGSDTILQIVRSLQVSDRAVYHWFSSFLQTSFHVRFRGQFGRKSERCVFSMPNDPCPVSVRSWFHLAPTSQ